MEVVQFITDSAASGLQLIHARLGPEAVVLSVRRLPAHGVARLLPGGGRVEILAGVPDRLPLSMPAGPTAGGPPLAALSSDLQAGTQTTRTTSGTPGRWQTIAWLEAMGLFPAHADHLQQRVLERHLSPPGALEEEWSIVREVLADAWIAPRAPETSQTTKTHVFIGPPGSGKTTVLCKWLTLEVLTKERSACVWRLDGAIANTAEFLSVHCEMLGVPVDRYLSETTAPSDLRFVDVPGVEMDDSRAISALRDQLSALPSPEIHLVLNAAYDADALMAQWRSFSLLSPTDLILTHLDEEKTRVKLWNLVLGTGCGIGFLSAGQKIPGEFLPAGPDLLFPSTIRR